MNIKILRVALMLGILFPLMAVDGLAQKNHEAVANVNFEFTVCNDELLPAGEYKIQPITNANPNVILISSSDRSVIMTCAHSVEMQEPASTGHLIFNRYGNQYFLSELWLQGELTGVQLSKSDHEEAILRELTREMKRGMVTVTVNEIKN